MPLATNSQSNKKPIFITLKKDGHNIIFAKPQSTTAGPSKIPKLSILKSDGNGSGIQGRSNRANRVGRFQHLIPRGIFFVIGGDITENEISLQHVKYHTKLLPSLCFESWGYKTRLRLVVQTFTLQNKDLEAGVKNVRLVGQQLIPAQSTEGNHHGYADARHRYVQAYQKQIVTHQSQQGPSKTYTPVNINLIHNKQKSVKQSSESEKASSSLNSRDHRTIAPESKTISKQKPVKRSYKKMQPTGTPKFNFPIPPPKIDFKVSTNTVFNTAIDESAPLASDSSMSSIRNETVIGIDQSNGVPSNCTVLKKIFIDTTKSKGSKDVIPMETTVSNTPITLNASIISKAPIAPKARIASNAQVTSERASGLPFLELQETAESLNTEKIDDHPVTTQVIDTTTERTEYGEIIKRLDRIEGLQTESSKRDAQILVAVKKLCLQYTKHNNDNDEIKNLLPLKEEIDLIAMDTRIIEDSVFKEKVIAFLRGFKTTNTPENFTAFFSVLLSDELVDKFNLKGILGKKKLEGYKIMEIIQDLHKPMDKKSFEKLMRTTIELAKNRFHNDQYRKRLQLKAQPQQPNTISQ